MSLLHEVTLERLWSNYETRFGAPPPISNAGFDEAISFLREQLNGSSIEKDGAENFDDPIETCAKLACLDQPFAEAYRTETMGNA